MKKLFQSFSAEIVRLVSTRLFQFAAITSVLALVGLAQASTGVYVNQLVNLRETDPDIVGMFQSQIMRSGTGLVQLLFAVIGAAAYLQQKSTSALIYDLLGTPKRARLWLVKVASIFAISFLLALASNLVIALMTHGALLSAKIPNSVFSTAVLWQLGIGSLALSLAAIIGHGIAVVFGTWAKSLVALISLFVVVRTLLVYALVLGNTGLPVILYNASWYFPSVIEASTWYPATIQFPTNVNVGQHQLDPGAMFLSLAIWAITLVISPSIRFMRQKV
jgi:hypothetical protein